MSDEHYQPDPILKAREVAAELGVSRSWLYRSIARGAFPAPIQIGRQATGWPASEVRAWLASRPRGVR